MNQPEISVVLPTLGVEPALIHTIDEILDALPPSKKDILEIVVVYTPRSDDTSDTKKLLQEYPKNVRVVVEKKRGYGVAYITGFHAARGPIIITLDADLTYPADVILKLSELLEERNLDFINTNRLVNFEIGAFHWSHGFGNRFLTILMNILFYARFQDSQSGMWIFKKSILDRLDLDGHHWEFSAEIKIEASRRNLRCAEIPIEYRRRTHGASTNSVVEGLRIAIFMVMKKLRLSKYIHVPR